MTMPHAAIADRPAAPLCRARVGRVRPVQIHAAFIGHTPVVRPPDPADPVAGRLARDARRLREAARQLLGRAVARFDEAAERRRRAAQIATPVVARRRPA